AWAVGTEINLVNRLAQEHPEQTVFCLDPEVCPCSTMYRIHPSFLCWALENLAQGRVVNQVKVPPEIAAPARLALDRMLELISERAGPQAPPDRRQLPGLSAACSSLGLPPPKSD
ncbi:MAG: quinolinate synthase NadA, partial [Fimbriimonadales bacterium]